MNDLVPANATPEQIQRGDAILAKIEEMLQSVPTSGGDGLLGILEQIINIENPEQLDAAWNSAGFGEWLGYALRISNPRKFPSKIKGGVGFFLIVDAVVKVTGDMLTLTTSSVAIMGQILVAHSKAWLPMDFVPLEKEEPTENGYYPQHLKVWTPAMPQQPVPQQGTRRAPGQRVDGSTLADVTAKIKADRLAAAKPAATTDTSEEPGF